MNYRQDGKVWKLPEVIRAGWNTPHFYTVLGFRPPKTNDYFLSGGPLKAYRSYGDLRHPYLVIKLEDKAVRRSYWVREDA